MTLSFGRLLGPRELSSSQAIELPICKSARLPAARIRPAEVVNAAEHAKRILAEAAQQAAALLGQAAADLQALRAAAEADARAEGAAKLAAGLLALRAREAAADERALDRVLSLSRLLAERLLGEAIALDPLRIAALAKTALTEARGARRIHILAHPEDAAALETLLSIGDLRNVTRVSHDPNRSRGSLRLETELGVLDADLAPQLDRLTARLREGLAHGGG